MIETKKLNDSTLKRITKSDNTYEDIHITDVPSNVISEGTLITDSVLGNINYKDDSHLEFSKISSESIPIPASGKCIIYSTSDGKLYCAINGYNTFEISAITASDIIKKNGTTYVNNGALEYFNINNGIRVFSNSTKIGATPTRATETNSIIDAAYFDITDDEIKAIINNSTKVDIEPDFIKLLHTSSSLELSNDRFILSGKNTNIEIDSTKTRFNCNTNLSKASYGNNKIRIELEENLDIKNILNNTNLFSISQSGSI
ncbi:MAG: hypothetical protein K5892_01305, partial [Acholeplasmatales bacterium]|nr:hypothetical protein [Acholeplasmatales bacterium]